MYRNIRLQHPIADSLAIKILSKAKRKAPKWIGNRIRIERGNYGNQLSKAAVKDLLRRGNAADINKAFNKKFPLRKKKIYTNYEFKPKKLFSELILLGEEVIELSKDVFDPDVGIISKERIDRGIKQHRKRASLVLNNLRKKRDLYPGRYKSEKEFQKYRKEIAGIKDKKIYNNIVEGQVIDRLKETDMLKSLRKVSKMGKRVGLGVLNVKNIPNPGALKMVSSKRIDMPKLSSKKRLIADLINVGSKVRRG